MSKELGNSNIGVFVCRCQGDISGLIDVERAGAEIQKNHPGVCVSMHDAWCSDDGLQILQQAIRDKELHGVVMAACAPPLHELTFRNAVQAARLSPEACVVADIREGCSYIHEDGAEATRKAIDIIQQNISDAASHQSGHIETQPVATKALVIGGGIAGIQAALDIANSGYQVILVERQSSIGGHMIQLSETFPTLDCSQCILTPKMVETGQHSRIRLLTYSEIEEVTGQVGHFHAKIRRKAAYVDWSKCTGCGVCSEKCPKKVPAEFERQMGTRKAIYTPFPQAVPNKPVIDRDNCIFFQKGRCKTCEKFCDAGALSWDQEDAIIEEEVGAIVVATGYDLYPIINLGEYGGGQIADVIDGLAFERLLSASGPTAGEVRRPSDGKVPKEVVFIQCAGSRDPEKNLPYCSKICCMYTTKHAMLYKHRVHDGQPYVFYIDVRTAGKGYEEFYQRAVDEEDVVFFRGKVSRVFQEDGKVMVWGADTLTGKKIEVAADLVVLATAIVPSQGTAELLQKLHIPEDVNGFSAEAHAKLRPAESPVPGFFLAGCGQGPRDIPETVAQASSAASKVITLFAGAQRANPKSKYVPNPKEIQNPKEKSANDNS